MVEFTELYITSRSLVMTPEAFMDYVIGVRKFDSYSKSHKYDYIFYTKDLTCREMMLAKHTIRSDEEFEEYDIDDSSQYIKQSYINLLYFEETPND